MLSLVGVTLPVRSLDGARSQASSFKLLKEDESLRSTMAGFGQSFSMSAEQLAKGEKAICTLYSEKQHASVNDV